jgi:tetratricopeptide (TPR) repeat protein
MDWEAPIFVGREKELRQLGDRLELMIEGQGQVCFVTAEAGFGKTSLATEFARRAQQRHEDLLVVIGDCNAHTGISDPYLPFRELLSMLMGDTEDRVAQGMTTEENAGRLEGFLGVSKRILADVGPDLIDIFLPGIGIATRASAMVVGDKKVRRRRSDSFAGSAAAMAMADSGVSSEQSRIFEQVTSVLTSLAEKKPLLLILDDLHWVDDSSASLLFHLARRIEGSRIHVVGTFRPEEVALGRGEARHPMEQVVSELKRHYGDPVLALGEDTEAETRQFIDMLIDSEPNKLDESFRAQLHLRTNGHALFAAELLLDMQERGDLQPDASGQWVEGDTLDWKRLPARVEGVVEERINRLEDELQEILTIASVEGEIFTAQVVGRIQEISERQLLKRLTRELERRHRLVSEEGSRRVGENRISQFRFRHHMFQKYLYESLGQSEREQLHEDIASILESLYAGCRSTVAVQLARHYENALMWPQAAECYLLAGARASEVYACNEALGLAEQGISTLGQVGDLSEHSELLLELNLLLGKAQHHVGQFAESMDTFHQTAELAGELGAAEAMARAALGYDEPRWRCNMLGSTAVKLLTRALELLDASDSELRVYLTAHLALALMGTASREELADLLDGAIAMARRIEHPRALIESLRTRLNLDRDPSGIDARVQLIGEMLGLAERIEERYLQMDLLAFRIYDLSSLCDIEGIQRDLKAFKEISEEVGEPFYEYSYQTMSVAPMIQHGQFEEAERMAIAAFDTAQQLGVDNHEGVMGVQMFTIRREQGRLAEIAPVVQHFVNEQGSGAAWRPGLALIYADIGELGKAGAEFDQLSVDQFGAIPRDSLWQTSLTYLAETCCAINAVTNAEVLYELLLPYRDLAVVVGNASVCLGASARYLGQLASVLSRWDEAEDHFQRAMEIDSRMSALTWLAHTQFCYSRMLVGRGRPEDIELARTLVDAAASTAARFGLHGLQLRMKSADG